MPLLAKPAFCSPVSSLDSSLVVKGQSNGPHYAITGATGGVYPRIEVRDLEKSGGESWNLFLLAMTEFQAMDQHAIDSWYQIAGMS